MDRTMRCPNPLLVSWLSALVLLLPACSRKDGNESAQPPPPVETLAPSVRVARAARTNLHEVVLAPGRTVATAETVVHAPFDGILQRLTVNDGDRVTKAQPLGSLISQNSLAELEGARSMLSSAQTKAQRVDARRAIELAEASRVERPLLAPVAGIVVSHQASQGDLLTAHDPILTIANDGSIVFMADVPQGHLQAVRPGQRAEVSLYASSQPLAAAVHGVLPGNTDLVAPVRLDLLPSQPVPGLFGEARILVGIRSDVVAVPAAAVLRDDITGATRLAIVSGDRARWLAVETGVEDRGLVEIRSPPFEPGTQVIVQGQSGLPDGARVVIHP